MISGTGSRSRTSSGGLRDGVDVMAMLPYLAAYMGHAGIDSTLYYVHASPDFMDGYADLVADAERVVPETEEP